MEIAGGEAPTKSAIQLRIRGFKKDAGVIPPNGEITKTNHTGKDRKRSQAALDDSPATPTTKSVNDTVQLPPTPESLAKTTLSEDTQDGAAEGIGSPLQERALKKAKKSADYVVTIKQEPDLPNENVCRHPRQHPLRHVLELIVNRNTKARLFRGFLLTKSQVLMVRTTHPTMKVMIWPWKPCCLSRQPVVSSATPSPPL